MGEAPLTFARRGGIGYLTLNAPPKNEMDAAFFTALGALCARELRRSHLDGLVVHGAGRHFSCGANVEQLRAMLAGGGAGAAPFLSGNGDAFLCLEQLSCPVVAAVAGCCLGAGMELALACRYRLAATHATFALPESTFGLMPGCGGTLRLPALVGTGRAAEMILSGRTMLADEALQIGLVDAVVDRKELLAAAERLVRRLRSPQAPS